MGNRKAAEKELLRLIDALLPGSPNTELYRKRLARLSDEQFDEFMSALESGEQVLSLIAPNLSDYKLTLERNLALAKELGHDFFERLYLTDAATGTTYLTPERYLVMDLPVRRQQQLLVKKVSIPQDNKHVDELTGQPRNESKGSSMSFPEIQVLSAQGLNDPILEMIKFRGGDTKGFQAMNRQIINSGTASLRSIEAGGRTIVKSTETFSTYLKGMHLDNNLTGGSI